MIRSLLLILGLYALGSTSLDAQTAAPVATNGPIAARADEFILFDSPLHDFGTFKEDAGSQRHTFTFTNRGSEPIRLTDVKPNCGCTTPTYSKENIAPGATGTIQAEFNPVGRPGKFEKFITVKARPISASEDRVVILTIRGEVTARVKTVADFFPHKVGNLRMGTSYLNVPTLYHGEQVASSLKLYNESEAAITLQGIQKPAYIKLLTSFPLTLAAKDSITLRFSVDGSSVNDWGYVSDRLELKTNDPTQGDKVVQFFTQVVERFDNLTPDQKATAAKARFSELNHDFGTITEGQVVSHTFTISNDGQSDLFIRKTKPTCGCTASAPEKSVLKPGESTSITVSFNSSGRTGQQTKAVTVITNDPSQPLVNLQFKATVAAKAPAGGTTAPQAGSSH